MQEHNYQYAVVLKKIVPFSLGGKDLDSIKNSPMKFLGACVSFQSTSLEGFTFIHNKL